MKFNTGKKENIIRYLLEKIEQNVENPSLIVSEAFGINRNTVHKYINELEKEKIIERVKRGIYRLVKTEYEYCLKKSNDEIKNETDIFYKYFKNHISDLSDGIKEIWEYTFSEMINNVIDHSGAENLFIKVSRDYIKTEVAIIDDGIGIFEKIKSHFSLPSLDDAICELFKGKLTTDEKRHSGEGIFFSSRIMDDFTIWSSEKVFTHNKYDNNKFMDFSKLEKGTVVIMSISNFSNKKTAEIFDKYTNKDNNFTKTSIILKNVFDSSPISRSQARRVLNGLEKFEEIVLDFEEVSWMGQGFAHQIFVLYRENNPQLTITPINMNEDVTKMYNHVINTN